MNYTEEHEKHGYNPFATLPKEPFDEEVRILGALLRACEQNCEAFAVSVESGYVTVHFRNQWLDPRAHFAQSRSFSYPSEAFAWLAFSREAKILRERL